MGFAKMIELIQEKEKGKIVMVKAGAFYIARGKDAIQLHKILDLKLNCFTNSVCKVGFPIVALEKYTKLIERSGYSYIVYVYDKKLEKLELEKKYEGKHINEITEDNINCYMCKLGIKYAEDKYVKAVMDLYRNEQEELWKNKKN